ncbi:uncharacterized protein LOC131255738 isoform X3 [Magnolia sinica]|uniref:uncharacterized protein LOC131255738 isoform X3 n=1 Tax=Magnolia sinica TaxID=86752 RepID=UPI0026596EFA|nr:uncharacterized protein LOC131255738 isoform X3 [Magnolia sinica]
MDLALHSWCIRPLVSKSGYVKVEKLMNVERYSHVMHVSSMRHPNQWKQNSCPKSLDMDCKDDQPNSAIYVQQANA